MTPLELDEARAALRDEYDVVTRLGHGAHGTVFKAIRRSDELDVALKVQRISTLDDDASRPQREARFEREARLCGTLNHPRIVRLLSNGRRGELLFIAFEFVPGETLSQVLARRGRLPANEAYVLAAQLLDALDSAHSQGIVHRDLKPDNLILVRSGAEPEIKVLDFGIAGFEKGADESPAITRSREILGTPCYSAPEQLRGEPVTARSDIYAWGLIVLECLTGRRVMDGGTLAQVFHAQLSAQEIALPAQLAAHPLGRILRRALAKSARARSDAAAILEELRHVNANDILGDFEIDAALAEPTLELMAPRPSGEIRQGTAVSCSLRVFPLHTQHVDVEVLHAIQADQLRICSEVAAQHGGHVLGTLANRTVILFGVPRANETDARMATRTALELTREIGARRPSLRAQMGFDLDLRIGIHTDNLLVAASGSISGPAIDTAAWLETHAPSGVTIVSQATRLVLQRQLRLSQAPRLRSFSLPDGPTVYALEVAGAEPEDEFSEAPGQPELVGRDQELGSLLEAWARARAGKGSVALVRGEPGIGKTRLVNELRRRAQRIGAVTTTCQCSPEHRNTALAPILATMRKTFEADALAADRFEQLLATCTDEPIQVARILRAWLGWASSESHSPLELSAERQRALLLGALSQVLCAIGAGAGAHLLVLEDLQWADPTTRELVAKLCDLVVQAPVLVLLTARPEYSVHPAGTLVLELGRLVASDAVQLALSAAGTTDLPEALLAKIVERTDGVPLFVEELTRSLLERPSSAQMTSLEVPSTLRDLLTSRLDRLGGARETAQLAAAIGRDFDAGLLEAIVEGTPEVLRSNLATLVEAQVLERPGARSNPTFRFRHALIRDAAWSSLLPARRRSVHRTLAAALEGRWPSPGLRELATLAWHYEHAADAEKAAGYRLRAGRAATAASAYQEAIEHLQAGIGIIDDATESQEICSQRLDLNNALGAVLIASQGFATDSVVATFSRARSALDRCSPTNHQRFATLKGLWTFHNARANYGVALELADELLALANQSDEAEFHLAARACSCQTALLLGRFTTAVKHGSSCDTWFRPARQQELVQKYGLDPWLTAASFDSLARLLLGRISEAEQRVSEIVAAVERLGSPADEASMLGQAAGVYLFIGGVGPFENPALERCRLYASRALEIAQKFGLRFADGYARLLLAMADAPRGTATSVEDLKQAVFIWRMLGLRAPISWLLSILAQGQLALHDHAAALGSAQEALQHCEQAGEGYGASEAHRAHALILADPRNPLSNRDAAGAAFERALAIAQSQDAHWLGLRAAYSFAVQLGSQRALDALKSSVEWFSSCGEASDTALLVEARKIIESYSR